MNKKNTKKNLVFLKTIINYELNVLCDHKEWAFV